MAWLERDDWSYFLFPVDVEGSAMPRHADFLRLWQSKRVGTDLPKRSDFGIEDFRPWLGWLSLLDVIEPDGSVVRFRLWGSRIANLTRMEMTGKTLQDRFGPRSDASDYNDADVAFIQEVVRRPAVGLAHGPVDWDMPHYTKVSTIRLPLSSRGDGCVDGIVSQVAAY